MSHETTSTEKKIGIFSELIFVKICYLDMVWKKFHLLWQTSIHSILTEL